MPTKTTAEELADRIQEFLKSTYSFGSWQVALALCKEAEKLLRGVGDKNKKIAVLKSKITAMQKKINGLQAETTALRQKYVE